MNIWSILGPILIQVIQAWINRKSGKMEASAADHAQMDRWATELEQHTKTATATAASDGLLVQVQELITAFRAHDWAQVASVVQAILFGTP